MDKKAKKIGLQLTFFLGGILLGFISFLLYNNKMSLGLYLYIITVFIIIFIMFFLIRAWFYRLLSNAIKELTTNVRKIMDGGSADFTPPYQYWEIQELYRACGSLRKKLRIEAKTKDSVLKIINSLPLNLDIDKLMDSLLPKIIEETKSNWAAFYMYNPSTGKLELKSSIGFSKNIYSEFDVEPGEGLAGLSIKSGRIEITKDIPDDTIYVTRTFLGKMKPKSIMSVPVNSQGELLGTLLIASVANYEKEQVDIIKMIRYYLGVAVSNSLDFERMQRLKNELQFQNQLIHDMNVELEDKVERRTRFLNNVIDNITEYSITAMDADGYITAWNKGAEILRGYTEEEALGAHVTETYMGHDKTNGFDAEERMRIAREEGKFKEQGWYTKKDGTRYYADVVVTPLYDEQGKLEGFTNITRDITNLKDLEQVIVHERYLSHELFNNSTNGLILTDRSGKITNINQKAAQFLLRRAENMVGHMVQDFFVNKDLLAEKIARTLAGSSMEEWEDDALCPGETRPFRLRSMSFDGVEGEKSILLFNLIFLGQEE